MIMTYLEIQCSADCSAKRTRLPFTDPAEDGWVRRDGWELCPRHCAAGVRLPDARWGLVAALAASLLLLAALSVALGVSQGDSWLLAVLCGFLAPGITRTVDRRLERAMCRLVETRHEPEPPCEG